MAKEKLSFKSGSRFCYRVKENNLKSFYDKIVDVARSVSDEDFIIELRLDYLINKKIDVKEIIDCISKVKKDLVENYDIDNQFIATIRNFSYGGNCLIDDKTYLSIVELLYDKSKVDAIDIDFDFYENKAAAVKKIFKGKKTLIITYCCQDKVLSKDEYNELFKTLLKTPAYVVKVVTKAFSYDDTENLINTAKEFESLFDKNKKVPVVISTGKIGLVSRVCPEYTNTKIVYIDTYDLDMEPAGEITRAAYNEYRKMIKDSKQ